MTNAKTATRDTTTQSVESIIRQRYPVTDGQSVVARFYLAMEPFQPEGENETGPGNWHMHGCTYFMNATTTVDVLADTIEMDAAQWPDTPEALGAYVGNRIRQAMAAAWGARDNAAEHALASKIWDAWLDRVEDIPSGGAAEVEFWEGVRNTFPDMKGKWARDLFAGVLREIVPANDESGQVATFLAGTAEWTRTDRDFQSRAERAQVDAQRD